MYTRPNSPGGTARSGTPIQGIGDGVSMTPIRGMDRLAHRRIRESPTGPGVDGCARDPGSTREDAWNGKGQTARPEARSRRDGAARSIWSRGRRQDLPSANRTPTGNLQFSRSPKRKDHQEPGRHLQTFVQQPCSQGATHLEQATNIPTEMVRSIPKSSTGIAALHDFDSLDFR